MYSLYGVVSDWTDENKAYIATYGSAYFDSYRSLDVWELTPDQNAEAPWRFRNIYRKRPAYPDMAMIWSIQSSASVPYRMYLLEFEPPTKNLDPVKYSSIVELQSGDQGATWNASTIAHDSPYFHATDFQEVDTSTGKKQFMSSTDGLWVNDGTGWIVKSYIDYTPQGFSSNALAVDPRNPDTIYAKMPLYVIQSTNGGALFQLMDNIQFGLGQYFPNSTGPNNCPGAWREPNLTTLVFNALAVHPSRDNTLYAASDIGLWKNEKAKQDGGYCYSEFSLEKVSLSWELVPLNGVSDSYLWSVAFDQSDSSGNTLWVG